MRPDIREVRNVRWSPGHAPKRDALSGGLLSVAAVIIAVSSVGAGYVAYNSQRLFADAHLQGSDHMDRARIIAALPDVGWGAMALVALVAALRGQSSLRARIGVVIFFTLSLAAQVMYAPLDPKTHDWNPQALLVAVIAPIALAWMLESFIVEVRRWAASKRGLDIDESPILNAAVRTLGRGLRAAVRFPLWMVRLMLAPKETGSGLRDWFLDEAPLAPGRTRASLRADAALAQAGTAEQLAEQARQQASTLVQQAQQDAADQIERMRAQLAAQLQEMSRGHEQQLAEQARAADERAEHLQAEASAKVERLTRANTDLAGKAEQLRKQLELLSENTTAKARLHALYEQLGRDGDPRYMDRTYIREIAKKLGPRAGLQSVGTADAYLREFIATKNSATGVVGKRDLSVNGTAIRNGE